MVYETLLPIKRSKYPALSEDEERLSIPLQTLCGAIFDAILVHMLNTTHQQALLLDSPSVFLLSPRRSS